MRKLLPFLFVIILVICPSVAPAEKPQDGIDNEQILQYGSSGDDVLALQTRLTELGYYKGKLSGNFLEGTKKAVESFQKDCGLEQTGIADEQTLSILYSDTPLPSSETSESSHDVQADSVTREPQGITFQGIPWNSTPEETIKILTDSGFIENSSGTRSRIKKLISNPYSSLKKSWFYYGSSKTEPYTYKHKSSDKVLSDKLKELTVFKSDILKTIGKRTIDKLTCKYSLASGSPQLVEISITFTKLEKEQDPESLLLLLKTSYGEPAITKKGKDGQNYYIWYGEYNTVVALHDYPVYESSNGKSVLAGNSSSVYFGNIDGLILSNSVEIPEKDESPTDTPQPQPAKEDTGF